MPTAAQLTNYGLVNRASTTSPATPGGVAPEAATQSFKSGDLLINSTGKAAIGASAGSNVTNSSKILGFACAPASGTTNTAVTYDRITDETVWLIPADTTTALSQVGGVYQLTNHATMGWIVDISETSNPVVQILGISDAYAVGETYGLVYVKFIEGVYV